MFRFLLWDEVHGDWKRCCVLPLGDGVCKDGVGDGGICNAAGSGEMGGGDGVTGEEQSEVVVSGVEEQYVEGGEEDVQGDGVAMEMLLPCV